MAQRTPEPIQLQHLHGVYLAPMSSRHEPVQLRAAGLRARNTNVYKLSGNLPAAAGRIFPEFSKLDIRVQAIVGGGNARIKGRGLMVTSFGPAMLDEPLGTSRSHLYRAVRRRVKKGFPHFQWEMLGDGDAGLPRV